MWVAVELNFKRLSVINFLLERLADLIDKARFASDNDLLGVSIPLEVIDKRPLRQVHHADGLVQTQVGVAICLEEKDLSVTGCGDEHSLVGSVSKFDHGGIVSLEYQVQIDILLVDADNTNDT